MKKCIALILAVATMSFLLASCGSKIKDGAVMTNDVGESIAVVTDENGGITRDDSGNAILLQTDENGKNVTDKDGNNVSNPVALDHALVVGDKIEMNSFSFTIPKGWSNLNSYESCRVRRDTNTDQIEIRTFEGGSYTETKNGCLNLYDQLRMTYGLKGGKFEEGTSKIDNIDAEVYECYVSKDVSGADKDVYWSYIFFQRAGTVYVIQISSNDSDLTGNKEISSILNTIKFV